MAETRPLSLLLRLLEPTVRVAERLREVVGVPSGDADLPVSGWYALGVVALVIGEPDVTLSREDWRAAWSRLTQLMDELGPSDVLLRVCADEYAVGTLGDIGESAMSNRDIEGRYAYIHEVTAAPLVQTLDEQVTRAD